MSTLLTKLKTAPYLTFLMDGLGASVSTALLLLLLFPMEEFFGMPASVVLLLGIIASILMIFSFSCFYFKPKKWSLFLRFIIIANTAYAGLTSVLLFIHAHTLTAFGFAYFIGEILILFVIIILELKVAAIHKKE